MKYSYFPGCTLHNQSRSFRDSTISTARELEIELEELPDWYCCGAVFPLRSEDIMSLLSSTRNLVGAKKEDKELVTLCSACYQVLKRTNYLILNDAEKREKLNSFLEEKYDGSTKVLHFLEVIRKDVGWEGLKNKVKTSLTGLRAAPYYGCLLLRPQKELAFDHPENPTIFENFLQSLGCETVDFPYKTECCGAYLGVTEEKVINSAVLKILQGANKRGIEVLITSCPLCLYNLEVGQKELMKSGHSLKPVPVLYFTQLLALALGLGVDVCHFEEHLIDPLPVLERIR